MNVGGRNIGRNMHYGWLQDGIWDLAKSNWEVFQKLPYCLVTCVDSSPDVAFMARAEGIIEKETSCSALGKGLLIRDARVLEVCRSYNLFNGFDEIWLYEDCPTIGKPQSFSIVSPLDLNEDPLPQGLLEWFTASACILGLGDGFGMNYITTQKQIVGSLMARQRGDGAEQ